MSSLWLLLAPGSAKRRVTAVAGHRAFKMHVARNSLLFNDSLVIYFHAYMHMLFFPASLLVQVSSSLFWCSVVGQRLLGLSCSDGGCAIRRDAGPGCCH